MKEKENTTQLKYQQKLDFESYDKNSEPLSDQLVVRKYNSKL